MIWASPWVVPSGPSSMVAPALGWFGSEEGGVLGALPFHPARMLLMCPSDARCVREWNPWHWLMHRFQNLELLDGMPQAWWRRRASVLTEEDGREGLHGLRCNFLFYKGLLCNSGMYCASSLIPSFLSKKKHVPRQCNTKISGPKTCAVNAPWAMMRTSIIVVAVASSRRKKRRADRQINKNKRH